MSLSFSLVEVIFFTVGINLVLASSYTSGVFSKLPMTSSGINDTSIKRNLTGMPIFQCFVECTNDANCLGVSQVDTFSCQLLDAIGQCHLSSESEANIPYYQRTDLSKLEITSKEFMDNKLSYTTDPTEIWLYDCFTTYCRHSAAVGVSDIHGNLTDDLDYVHCGTYGGDLEFDLASSVSVDIRSTEAQRCPHNMVVTAIWDHETYAETPDLVKCSPIKNGWKVDYDRCETCGTDGIEVIECDRFDGQPGFVVGIHYLDMGSDALNEVTCCPVFK